MKSKPNRNKLIQLMQDNRLKCKDVADMLGVKMQTVKVYRCKIGVDIPDNSLELLRLKLR